MPYPITFDSKTLYLEGAIIQEVDLAFPQSQIATGQRQADSFGLHQRLAITGPFSVGLRQGNDVGHGFDQENVLAMWPGQITRGPQKQSPTAALPTTFKLSPGGLIEALDTVWMFGSGASTSDEPLWFYVGSTDTWTDATLNADIAADVDDVTGLAEIGDTLYAASGDPLTISGDVTVFFKSTDKTTWVRARSGGVPDLSFTTARFILVDPGGAKVYVGDETASSLQIRNTTITDFESVTSITWAGSGSLWTPSTLSIRGMTLFPDASGNLDMWWTHSDGLIHFDISAGTDSQAFTFLNKGSSHSGRLLAIGSSLYFTDGPNLARYEWVSSAGDFKTDYVGPEVRTDIDNWSGLATDKQGDITAIVQSRLHFNWIYVFKAGLTSSDNGSVLVFDRARAPGHEWFCIYKNSTAQRIISGGFESAEDDETLRLHILEEQTSGGDQDPKFFVDAPYNPLERASYKYATTGKIVDSERDMGFPYLQKSFLTAQVDVDDLSANEKLTIKFAHDGGSLDAGQDITSSTSPPQVFSDGPSSSNVGKLARRQKIELTLTGTEGATDGPTLKSMVVTYNVPPQRADGTSPIAYGLPLIFTKELYQDGPEQAYADLQTSMEKGTLLSMTLADGEGAIKVLPDPNRPLRITTDPGEGDSGPFLKIDGDGLFWVKLVI